MRANFLLYHAKNSNQTFNQPKFIYSVYKATTNTTRRGVHSQKKTTTPSVCVCARKTILTTRMVTANILSAVMCGSVRCARGMFALHEPRI